MIDKNRKDYDHDLIKKAQKGNKKAREEIINRHINLVRKIASKVSKRMHSYEDLIQEGICGLLLAIDRFDTDKDVQFSTYAVFWIKSQITNATMQGVSKDQNTRKIYWHGSRAAEELWKENGSPPTCEEIATRLGVDPFLVVSVHASVTPTMEYEDIDASSEESPEDILIRKDTCREIRKAVSKLSNREFTVIRRRFLNSEQVSLTEIGEDLGVSRETSRQAEIQAFKKLKGSLGEVR